MSGGAQERIGEKLRANLKRAWRFGYWTGFSHALVAVASGGTAIWLTLGLAGFW